MSHFSVIVFSANGGEDDDELLAPYSEDLTVEPYMYMTRDEVIAERKESLEYWKAAGDKISEDLAEEIIKKETFTDDDFFCEYVDMYCDSESQYVGEDGNIWSTYNNIAKWDWYSVGGRFGYSLCLKDGSENNVALVSNIDPERYIPFAFVTTDGEWVERGNMGWFACVTNEMGREDWKETYVNYVNSLDGNVVATVYDCHI